MRTFVNPNFSNWLDGKDATGVASYTPARCMLIVVNYYNTTTLTESTMYLSTVGYVSGSSATSPHLPNQIYNPVIQEGIKYTEEVGVDFGSSPNLSFGDISLVNIDGSIDSWINHVWTNRSIKIYYGDTSWPVDDFELVFTGTIADLKIQSIDRLSLQIRDKLERLNTTLYEKTIGDAGGTASNSTELAPLCFGEAFNITPKLLDPSIEKYIVHNGPVEQIYKVRSNGVPLLLTTDYTVDAAAGTFTLVNSAMGTTITCTVQGSKPGLTYLDTIDKIISELVTNTNYGFPSTALGQFTAADIDTAQLAQFAANGTGGAYTVGIYITDRENLLDICYQIAASVGAQLTISTEGKLRLIQIVDPSTVTPVGTISRSDIIQFSLNIEDTLKIQAGYTLNYSKNYTVMEELLTEIDPRDKVIYAREYFKATATPDTTVQNLYGMFTEPEPVNTLLVSESNATAEANRRLNLLKTKRRILSFEGTPSLFKYELGDPLYIQHPRFSLDAANSGLGTKSIVVSKQVDWANSRIFLKVLI